ncbi:MAG: hypothetical protein OEW75_06655 [Cyclobacteriaceae bacterium]|nr:hypothetical protein [Cyclobacteriaceae bacterium]
MKNLIFKIITLVLISGFSFGLFAQTATIEDVRRREFRGISPILNESNNLVEGYYSFYITAKESKGMRNFVFALFDKNLKLIKNTSISITKRSMMDASSYNGKYFLFVFNDPLKKSIYYITVDRKGNIIKRVDETADKIRLATSDVYAADDGFFLIKPIKEKKNGYEIEKVDEQLNIQWNKKFVPEKGIISVEAIESSGDKIFVIQKVAPSILNQKSSKGELVCLASNSGDILFNYPLFDGTVTCQPSSFLIDKDKNIVVGGMYFDGERWDNVNSDGIFFLSLNELGEKVAFSTMSWKDGLQYSLKDTEGSLRIGSKPKVIFHEITQYKDGSYQVIGETFQKNLNLLPRGIADVRSAITGLYIGDMSEQGMITTLEIMDFILFNFSTEGKITSLYNLPKENTKVYLYPPYTTAGGLYLAKLLKAYGMFNFGFTIKRNNNGEDQNLLVSRNLTKKDRNIRIQNLDPKKRSEEINIPLEKKWVKGYIGVAPNTDNKICIYFYNQKEKKVSLKLESFDL